MIPSLPPAIVLGGKQTALTAVRSLGRAGVPVHAVGEATDPVRHSRYTASFTDLGSGEGMQERWLAWLEQAPRGVLMPCSDDGLELVARNRTRLVELGHVPFESDDEVLLAMLDKERTYALGRAAGVPTPHSVAVRSPADTERAIAELSYPCGVKPLESHLFFQRSGVAAKVLVARNADELRGLLGWLLELGIDSLATELVEGGDDRLFGYFTYMDENGEPLFHFTNRKLRQYPIHFGVGCYVTGEWDAETAELGLRFVKGVGLRGVAHVEFKRDARDGQLKLIECNHRFNLAVELLYRSGVDLPRLTYSRLTGRPSPSLDPSHAGRRLWLPLWDIRAFLDYRVNGELTARAWARSLLHRQSFAVWSADDPVPSLVEYGRLVGRRAGRLRRLGRASTRG